MIGSWPNFMLSQLFAFYCIFCIFTIMKRSLLLLCALVAVMSCGKPHPAVSDCVDVFWGTGVTASPLSEGMSRGWNWEKAQSGNTSPAAVLPYGWVSACAFTGGYSSGYGRVGYSSCFNPPVMYGDTLRSYGFTHFNHSGAGLMGRFYNYFLFTPGSPDADFSSPSALVNESARPGYYSAELADYGASFELTARPYAACHRYSFPSGKGCLKVDISHCGLGTECFKFIRPHQLAETIDSCCVSGKGSGEWIGVVRTYGLDIFFDLRVKGSVNESFCTDSVVFIGLDGQTAETAIGFSLISQEEASERAADAMASGFEKSLHEAEAVWSDAIRRIRVRFSDAAMEKRFYSALYHSLVKPTDCGKGYVDFATLWDMYRTQMPLAYSFFPEKGREMALYLARSIDRFGHCPISHTMEAFEPVRSGQASALGTVSIADAFFRGLMCEDEYPRLKELFRKDLDYYGFLNGMSSPTHILDISGAYRAVAYVAETCGDMEYADSLMAECDIWEWVYEDDGLMLSDASYYEGNRYNYSFRPLPGMDRRVEMAGGPDGLCSLLDEFFCIDGNPDWDPQQDRIRRRDHFEGMNNECDMDAPYAYLWCGRPDRTAEVIDAVRRYRFSDGPGGCPGNNDSGSTGSWYVWNCLGLYPLTGTPYYLLASPSVDAAELQFGGGKLKIRVERESPASIYPQWYKFNGRKFRSPWLRIEEVETGGTLVFHLADSPAPEAAPIPEWL